MFDSFLGRQTGSLKIPVLLPSLPCFISLSMIQYGMGHSFGQYGSAVLVLSPPIFLCTLSLLARQQEKQSPWLCVSATQQQLNHQCIISLDFITAPKHSTKKATVMKINSITTKSKVLCSIKTNKK